MEKTKTHKSVGPKSVGPKSGGPKLGIIVVLAMLVFGCALQTSEPASPPTVQLSPPKQSSSVVTTEIIDSAALGRQAQIVVYLPAGFDPTLEYPVLYLFHGHGGKPNQWLETFMGSFALDALIESGEIAPMIVVCPQVDGGYGLNTGEENIRKVTDDGSLYVDIGRYEDYLFEDVMPYVEGKYGISKDPVLRGIGGFSMGGHMALRIGLDHPELFSKIGAHAAVIKKEGVEFTGLIKETIYPTEELRKVRDPYLMVDAISPSDEAYKNTKVYMDIGDQDSKYHIEGLEALYHKFLDKNIQAEFYVGQGGHDSAYIGDRIVNYFRFYGF